MTDTFWSRFVEFYQRNPRRLRGRKREEAPLCRGVGLLSDDPQENDRLLEDILSGRRTAIITPLTEWPAGKEIPGAEEFRVLVDSQGQERCVLRSAGAHLVAFRHVPESLALREGLDSTLAAWQARTRARLIALSRRHGNPFSLDALLVVETFSVAYWEE